MYIVRKFALLLVVALILAVHAWWVVAVVRWVDFRFYFLVFYGFLLIDGISNRYINPGWSDALMLVSLLCLGPLSDLLGEYGRRGEVGGVINSIAESPFKFILSSYIGEFISGGAIAFVLAHFMSRYILINLSSAPARSFEATKME